MKQHLRKVKVLCLTAAMALSVVSFVSAEPSKSDVSKDLAKAKQATAKYHDINKAEEDGYVPGSPPVPGMGIHYVKPILIDEEVDVTKPEALLYIETKMDLSS
ncbi:hypothetical protein [Ammoniphilus sp. YIM 78166]|uniref:hypothetical protein n=1 Tax=Ammoniphilus sp. YIM 78166 TaxID=1644106 RepID=UPI00106FD9D3|nr:hypothetical protein [Ammoniphilus sp. YIM 78166]